MEKMRFIAERDYLTGFDLEWIFKINLRLEVWNSLKGKLWDLFHANQTFESTLICPKTSEVYEGFFLIGSITLNHGDQSVDLSFHPVGSLSQEKIPEINSATSAPLR